MDCWRWQYREGPAGPGILRLALSRDKIVGHAAAIPFRFLVKGQERMGCLSLDSMTHSDFRGQGMFTRLEEELYQDLMKAGVEFIYGFPNDHSMDIFLKKLEWKHWASLPVRVRPLRWNGLVKNLSPLPMLNSCLERAAELSGRCLWPKPRILPHEREKLRWIDRFDSRIDLLWETSVLSHQITLKRDSTFLNWRYADPPGRTYRILVYEQDGEFQGVAVVRAMEAFGLLGGMIMELKALSGRQNILETLLDASLEHFSEQGLDLAACLTTPGLGLDPLLKSRRFLIAPPRWSHKEWFFAGRSLPHPESSDLLEPFHSWLVTFGDTDII